MAKDTKAIIRDQMPEYHWWTRLPNIVLQKIDDPYELALLFVIRKVAGDGEDGICYMGLRRLAKIAKMGFNTARRKILSLAEKGLIHAELRKAPRGWTVYHITFPRSVWEENEEAYHQLSDQTEPTVPEELQDCTRDDTGTVPESTPRLRTLSTKNHIKKKRASLFEKDEHGKYIDRSPLKRCPECGQYQRQCYCEEIQERDGAEE